MMRDPRTQPRDELRAIEDRLAELEVERSRLLERRNSLLAERSSRKSEPLRPEQKVELFQRLFRGRTDVYATRWENAKGRSGYAVACENEWVVGVCQKPKIKCGECPNRKFKQLDGRAIFDHLSGRQVVGLYPLLPDSNCYLLAVDFDKVGWREAVMALAQACRQVKIPYAIEVSRSGNGAHLWIFFSDPVSAELARRLGFGLLDRAMAIYPQLSFDSYDRLFPNQDRMPMGGFGNLIALPLQRQARRKGNSLFVDDRLQPFEDQWSFLSRIRRLSADEVQQIAEQLISEVTENGETLDDPAPPWEKGLRVGRGKIDGCPHSITLTLANRLYLKLEEIPAELATRLKRVASFANPVFFKTQALRFSTHGIPRYITAARIEDGYLSLPRGCFDEALRLIEEQEIAVEIDDKRSGGEKLEAAELLGELRKEQSRAVKAVTAQDTGILHAPTAFGKTVTAIGIIVERKVSTLILTHSRQLLEQWKERAGSFLAGVEVGVIGGGKKSPGGKVDIATYQSLISKKDNTVAEIIHNYGQVIIDECHHISAPRYEMLLNEVRSKYVVGLTATPNRQDGLQKIMFMHAGPIRHTVPTNPGMKFEQRVMVVQRHEQLPDELMQEKRPHISKVYRWLSENERRNKEIITDVLQSVSKSAHCLLLTERREHAQLLAEMLVTKGVKTVVLRGAMRAKERDTAAKNLNTAQVIVATGKYVGEGFDLPSLDTLFLALPIAWKGTLAQYAGRIHREIMGKERVTIYDYADTSLPMLQRMYKKREKGYKAMGYDLQLVSDSKCDTGCLDL